MSGWEASPDRVHNNDAFAKVANLHWEKTSGNGMQDRSNIVS